MECFLFLNLSSFPSKEYFRSRGFIVNRTGRGRACFALHTLHLRRRIHRTENLKSNTRISSWLAEWINSSIRFTLCDALGASTRNRLMFDFVPFLVVPLGDGFVSKRKLMRFSFWFVLFSSVNLRVIHQKDVAHILDSKALVNDQNESTTMKTIKENDKPAMITMVLMMLMMSQERPKSNSFENKKKNK